MKRHTFLAAALIFLLTVGGHIGHCEPASGVIVTAQYGVGKNGEAVGQKRTQRITFQGHNVRTETFIGGELVEVAVGGDYSWSSAPAAGRMVVGNQPRKVDADTVLLSYPALIRRSFARFFAPHPLVGKEAVKGFPCRKYAWHEEAVVLGDIGAEAQDVSYWVYDDDDFPFPVAHQFSSGGKQELIELRLGEAVSPELFAPPKDLAPVQSFQLPQKPFTIELQETRTSTQYGWKVHSTEVFAGDGAKVTRTYDSTTEHTKKPTVLHRATETLTYEQAGAALGNRLQTPPWMSVKKTGDEEVLQRPCTIQENIIEGLPKEKSWITDHPLLGTIRLHCITESPGDISDRSVTRLEIQP